MARLSTRMRQYLSLIKSLQTGLLLTTGLAGFMSTRCPFRNWEMLLAVAGSLFLAISGSTVLNMWYDRDIDARMGRTQHRPLPAGQMSPREALLLGVVLSALGVGWALYMDLLYGTVVFAGVFFDVVIYTVWLKRRTPWSIVWGGIAGGMPVLAGRTLGTGRIEWVGILMALAILFWIPTHILTFSMRYREDYRRAGIPTFPSVYGDRVTLLIIAFSSVMAALMMIAAAYGIGLTLGYLRVMVILSLGLFVLAFRCATRPSPRVNFGLFKYASFYMLGTMGLMMFGV